MRANAQVIAMHPNVRLLTKIATLYYKTGLTQAEVAKRLGISRQSVGRHLNRALEYGLVKIEIDSSLVHCTELESDLEKRFNLIEAIVITPPTDTEQAAKDALGAAGAEFLTRRIQSGQIIGVSWSSTVLACAERLDPVRTTGVTVVQLNGSLDRATYSTRAEYIVDRLARAVGGQAITLAAPLFVDRPEIIESLISDSRISAALEIASQASFVIFGVGDISEESSLYKTNYMDDEMLKRLKEAGAVGDICGRFFDIQGGICVPEYNSRTLAIDLDQLRTKELSVAIAGMPHKMQAIMGALEGRYCNVLVTDEATARSILANT